MRELIVNTFMTLDGVMQAPGGRDEDRDGGFEYGGWSVSYWDDQMFQAMAEQTGKPFAMVLGRRSYDILSAYWPSASEAEGGPVFNNATKYVASRGNPELEWSNSVLIKGDAAKGLAALKQEDGPELQLTGSANLLQSLLSHNLVDRFFLWTFPVVIGSGKKLFGDGTLPAGLRMVDHKVSSTGVVMATYEVAGDVPTGTFSEGQVWA
jgi:dihydrofolate reductase